MEPTEIRYDCFISYATDDWDYARSLKEQLASDGLTAFLDVPRYPVQSPLRVLFETLRRRVSRGRSVGDLDSPDRLPAAEVEARLARWLEHSASILVVWTHSHRGSYWSGLELDLFESGHRNRPIFVIRFDDTPWAAPTEQWAEVAGLENISRRLIEEHTQPRRLDLTAPAPRRFDALLRPERWSGTARRLRSGTTVLELMALRQRRLSWRHATPSAVQAAGVSRSAITVALCALIAVVATAVVGLVGSGPMSATTMASRHLVFDVTMLGSVAVLISVQAPLPTVAFATMIAGAVGVATQLLFSAASPINAGAGASGGALLGALSGSALVLEGWPADAIRHIESRRAALRATALALALTALLAAAAVALAGNELNVRDWRLVGLMLLLLVMPAVAVWAELSGIVRARAAVFGLLAAAMLVIVALATAILIATMTGRLDQQALTGGLVAGLGAGLGSGAIFLAPGALMPRHVPSSLRTSGSVATLAVMLFVLRWLFEGFQPHGDFTRDLRAAVPAYTMAGLASAATAAAWRLIRGSWFGPTVPGHGPTDRAG